jgi:sterol desaturase/sphingolipid hydroxylase (fatty acid hydroxylase superfamily)
MNGGSASNIFTELLGHSGLRIEATAVNPMTWLLRMFDMELVIEDHDLHHRTGWRRSHNYGKQTRVWDRLFGTTVPRVEGCKGKIDYVNTAKIPMW